MNKLKKIICFSINGSSISSEGFKEKNVWQMRKAEGLAEKRQNSIYTMTELNCAQFVKKNTLKYNALWSEIRGGEETKQG